MGKGSSSQITNESTAATSYAAQAAASDTVTPAIAKSIAQDTETAQAQQLANRQRMRGISSTYLRGAGGTASGKSKLGQ